MSRSVVVRKVRDRRDLNKYIFFPFKIYKNDPYWVPPLVKDVKERLDRKKNPFFEHSEMDLFLAYKEDELVGRVAAIVDENHNAFHDEKTVFFGLYESINEGETTAALLDEVSRWGKERGMTRIRGPMNLSMNDECAFLLEGFDSPPVFMMPYNPPYYLELMEKYGMVKAKDLFAFFMTRDHETAEKVQAIVEKIRQETNITLRGIDMKKLEEEAERIKFVYNNAWEKNWGFVPWTENEMNHMIKKLKGIADPNLIVIAEEKGRPVGVAFGLPNFNEVIKKMDGRLTPIGIIKFLFYKKKIKGMRAIVFGILKEYRQSGISYLLYSEFERRAREAGYEWGEMSWQLEDNEPVNRFNTSIGGRIYKKYRIFEKDIV